jgi:hypothetical protein
MLPRSITTPLVITGNKFSIQDRNYYIYLDAIGSVRLERFLYLSPSFYLSSDLLDVYSFIISIYQDVTNIERLGDLVPVANRLMNVIKVSDKKTAGELQSEQLNIVYELCALFILTDGEDATVIEPTIMSKKIDDWKKHVDFVSFFLFAQEALKMFRRS